MQPLVLAFVLLLPVLQDAKAHFDAGGEKLAKKDYDGAIAEYTSAIELDPGMKEAYFNRSLCRNGKGDHAGVIADCTKALEIDPDYVIAFTQRGWARYRKADYQAASSDFAQSIQREPGVASHYRARGLMRRYLDNYEGSIADCTKAIELKPGAGYFADRAWTHWEFGRFDEADKDYVRSLELDSKSARTYHGRGWCRIRQGRFADAVAEADKAIECDPKIANSYNVRGYAKLLKGDLDGAQADYDRLLALEQSSVGYATRGYVKARKGLFDEAARDLKNSIETADVEQGRWWARYWSASLEALRAKALQSGERKAANERALSMLEKVMKASYINRDCMCHRLQKDHLREDEDFAGLREDPRFTKLVEK